MHAAHSELYEYDQINQIKSLDRGILNQSRDAVTATNFTESWNFDKTGNWSSYNKNGVMEARTHNAANELQGIATHDANGNMTLMPGLKGKYDAWNRLVEVRDASDNPIASYGYNGLNQRIGKTVGSAVTKSFFNENWQELESTADNATTTYVWGLRYIDDLICREKGQECLYSLADPNWNVVATCDANGDFLERMKYDAFGKVTWLDEDFEAKNESDYAWNRTFTGQVFDAETGLMLYRNRFYHTGLGRFVTKDPIGYASEDVNLYRYVSNTPPLHLDPDGKKFVGPTCSVCLGAFQNCMKRAGSRYAICVGGILTGAGLLELGGCTGACTYLGFTGWGAAGCIAACTAGALVITGHCTVPRCDLGLLEDEMTCGNQYNQCAFAESSSECGCGPGNENWRPD